MKLFNGKNIFVIFTFVISIIAIVLSIIAICSLSDHSFCTDSTLVSIMGIIVAAAIGAVTILITWHIYNYIYLKQEMQEMINKTLTSFADDIQKYNQAISKANEDIDVVFEDIRADKQIKAHVEAIKIALQCKDTTIRDSAISYIMDRACNEYSETRKPENDWTLPMGEQKRYLYIVNKVDHEQKDILINYLNKAHYVDKDGKKCELSGNGTD